MSQYNIFLSTSEATVVSAYEPQSTRSDAYQSEEALEKAFIKMLTEQGYQYLKLDCQTALIETLRIQLEKLLQDKLRSMNLLKDAMVTVEFNNLIVTVLGEVGNPGVYHITRDDPTILDVIAQAGDLTIDGLRENVKVYRKHGNEEKTYLVDLTSAQNVFSSPVYYMQQGDIIYVEPNSKQINNSTNNGNTIRTYAFWMSLTSFLLSIGVLVFK